jgi:diguanylate cyclase (GGDEF)-like protein/PAS domain S-box-containing protein
MENIENAGLFSLSRMAADKSGTQNFFIVFDYSGRILNPSPSFCSEIGYKPEELIGIQFRQLIHPEDWNNSNLALSEMREGSILANFENRIQRKDGGYEDYSWLGIPNAKEEIIIAIYQNITVQNQIRQEFIRQQLKYKSVFDNLPMGIAITDDRGFILETNAAARKIFELEPSFRLRRSLNFHRWTILNSDGSRVVPTRSELYKAVRKKKPIAGIEFGLLKSDETIWLEFMASPIPIPGYGMAVGFKDITERKIAEEKSSYLANYDEITGFPRKKFLIEKLQVLLAESNRHGAKVAVLALDIDNFKYLNESFGHNFGDEFLNRVGTQIKNSIRNYDIISREGGDEFIIVLPDLSHVTEAAIVCESIQESLSKPIQTGNYSAFTSVSIGISIFPQDGKDPETLLKNADNALHQAKKNGKNQFSFYTASLQTVVMERLDIEHNLRIALLQNQFKLYYQPKINLIENSIEGAEALLRWNHPIKGLVSPDEFIPIAEETGLIVLIGEWVFREGIRQLSKWREMFGEFQVSINLSTKQFRHESLVKNIRKSLDEFSVPPSQLDVEITETALIENVDRAIHTLRMIRDLGVGITIDDFGTGYSSLGYLKKFPVHNLKIDKSFIQDLETNEDSQVIVRAVINLGHNLGLKVTAEGAETNLQCQLLRTMEADFVQGYYYAKPLPASQIEDFVRAYPNRRGKSGFS